MIVASLSKPLEFNVDSNENELALRRAAIVVTATLPDDLADALRVLDLARGLVTDFLRT